MKLISTELQQELVHFFEQLEMGAGVSAYTEKVIRFHAALKPQIKGRKSKKVLDTGITS